MKLSRNWLNEFTEVNVSDKEFCDRMTMSGSKVEGVEVLGSEITNVVVGKVLKTERHPDSDHLWVCQVDVGRESPLQIVTGAQNVHEGDLVPVAQHKSTLPGGVKIEKGKLRGVVSEGMLCSLGELGLTVNDYPYAVATASSFCVSPADPATTSGTWWASGTAWWTLRSPTTGPTASASGGWPERPPSPSARP